MYNIKMKKTWQNKTLIEKGDTYCLKKYQLSNSGGVIELPQGTEMVMPGDNVTITVELIHPIALEQGTKFSIREGGRTVGAGSVSKIDK